MSNQAQIPSVAYPSTFADASRLDSAEIKALLIQHLQLHSVLRGDFTLKSGRKSSWFIDSKQTACDPQGLILVTTLMLRIIPPEVVGIGGLTMGADPVSFATGAVASAMGRRLSAFSVRKEAKDHGGGGRIAGILEAGSHVVITEDTVTRGSSIMDAVDVVRALGANVVLATAIVDRGGTVGDMAMSRNIEFVPLVTALDLGFDFEGA